MHLAQGNASLHCDYCGTVVIIAPDDSGVEYLDQAADLSCPICHEAMWNAVLARVQISACKKCHGQLVQMGAFEGLVDAMRARHPDTQEPPLADPSELQRKVACPKCQRTMDTHFYFGGGHAVMFTCENCELHWLDGGVLMKIVRTPHESEPQPQV